MLLRGKGTAGPIVCWVTAHNVWLYLARWSLRPSVSRSVGRCSLLPRSPSWNPHARSEGNLAVVKIFAYLNEVVDRAVSVVVRSNDPLFTQLLAQRNDPALPRRINGIERQRDSAPDNRPNNELSQ